MFIFMAFVIWFGKRQDKTPIESDVSAKPPESVTTTVQPKTDSPDIGVNHSVAEIGTDAARQDKGQRTVEVLSTQNDIPIVFYGKLEDQFGNPVTSAQIAASVRIYNGVQSTIERFFVISDATGFFQINHGKGESLGLTPNKDGYVLASTDTFFKYSHLENYPYIPDQKRPAVIKMWKLQGAEPLVEIDQHYKLPFSNAPLNFDLLAGKIVPFGGDLKIAVKRSPGVVSGRTRQDWGVQIESVNGGLMDSIGQDRITYAAPADGYESKMTFTFSTNAPNKWSGQFNQGFFLMSRNGQVYAKLGLSFRINETPDEFMYVNLSGVANTNSSRNWEATLPH